MNTVTMVRLYIREGDKFEGHNLMREVFRLLHDQHQVAGLTVFRGIAGFGSHGQTHADDLLRLNVHLPLVLEFYDAPDVVDALLPTLRGMVDPRHIVCWSAQCAAD